MCVKLVSLHLQYITNDKLLFIDSTCQTVIQSAWAKCGWATRCFISTGKTECGSSAQSCQANVIQTVNGAEVAMGWREIPHYITNLLSKLYYLGHGLLYGCQSYHTKHWSNSPYLDSPAPTQKTHRHVEKTKCCKYNHHTNKQCNKLQPIAVSYFRRGEECWAIIVSITWPIKSIPLRAGVGSECW